jgi:putative restriction endonuclease
MPARWVAPIQEQTRVMTFYIGTTDYNWFDYLKRIAPEDVNFWRPGGKSSFKVLQPGAPFLLKLKSPYRAIAGVGFFSSHTTLPLSVAWDAFQNRNGCETEEDLRQMISSYRTEWWDRNPTIGCTILTNPVFFEEKDWIAEPENWANSIVQGKSYSTSDEIGRRVWTQVENILQSRLNLNPVEEGKSQLLLENLDEPKYRENVLSKVRLGQGAFRVLITDAYVRKCAITGEKTLPVLEAAHIKPYALSGPHFISNGLLLRSDIHKLFDTGYITITPDFRVEVSKRIKEEYQNGKEYYQFHGKSLVTLPQADNYKPNRTYIDWHNTKIFKN